MRASENEKSRWFYAANRKKVGPVSFAQLRQLVADGIVRRTDMVLREFTRTWQTAGSVENLFAPSHLEPCLGLNSSARPTHSEPEIRKKAHIANPTIPEAIPIATLLPQLPEVCADSTQPISQSSNLTPPTVECGGSRKSQGDNDATLNTSSVAMNLRRAGYCLSTGYSWLCLFASSKILRISTLFVNPRDIGIRGLVLLGCGLLLLFVGVNSLTFRDSKVPKSSTAEKVLVVERLELRDRAGKLRCVLSAEPDDASQLALYDENERLAAVLGAHSSLSGLMLKESNSKLSINIAVRKTPGPEIRIVAEDGKPLLGIGCADGGSAIGLGSNRTDGATRLALVVSKDGIPELMLFDSGGKVRASVGLNPDGRPAIAIGDRNQIGRIGMGLDPTGAPELSLKDGNGRIRGALSMGREGAVGLLMADETGNVVWRTPMPPP